MGIIRPATPGFLVCLGATVLFALVTFNVPYIKSIYFLKASYSQDGISGSVVFGTLGFCTTLPTGTTCSKPRVGYELNVNALLGDNTKIQIPNVLVKWITYALVLHVVALILSGIAALLGLLAHVREMSMAYCSSFVAGFAAAVGITAFIFDLVLFFVTKSRVKDVAGGSASFGTAIWLTLVGSLLLFFAGCFYGLGRCCLQRRSRGWNNKDVPGGDSRYSEQMRLDAVKAEADRKARQKQGEGGLPVFNEYEQMQPLTRTPTDEQYAEVGDAIVPLAGVGAHGQGSSARPFPGGYSQAPAGSRAVDAFYNQPAGGYPPHSQPQRHDSAYTQTTSGYTSSTAYAPSTQYGGLAAAAGLGGAAGGGYLTSDPFHGRQPTGASETYGHEAQNTSYYATGTSHQQMPAAGNYSTPSDPYAPQAQHAQTFNPDSYNATGYMNVNPSSSSPAPNANTTSYFNRAQLQDRSYTLGGGGYGEGTAPQLDAASDSAYSESAYNPYGASSRTLVQMPMAPTPIDTRLSPSPAAGGRVTGSSPRGPRPPSTMMDSPQEMPEPAHQPQYSDSPPVYDVSTAQPPGMWSTKN